ncbi:MAG TPA: hypothetical protein VEG38_12005 [Acidimicrobiia bacterium]|nr:hypothetical protein [Acidimicrobiia bacterium]
MIRRRMITAVAGVAVALFGLQAVGVSPSGAAESPRESYCTLAGSIAPDPGITYESKPTTYQFTGTMDCTADEPAHGTVTGTGKGTTGCFGGTSTALLKVAWDNGTESTINAQLGEFTYGTGGHGMVEEGTFEGSGVYLGWGRHAARAEERCANGQVKSYQYAGYMYFHSHSRHSGHSGH